MLDESLVFYKTSRGQREIAQGELAPKLRRALILVDGQKSVSDLAPLFRPGEVDAVLEALQASGHVTLDAAKAALPPAGEEGQAQD